MGYLTIVLPRPDSNKNLPFVKSKEKLFSAALDLQRKNLKL